jgi:tetratricopeptide (TPR) repeat protein
MHRTTGAWCALLAITIGVPLVASAQASTADVPPKVVVTGAAVAPPGKGSVMVEVFVKKDGSVGKVTLKTSTNHDDDAAALQIAKGSTYKPAIRDGKPVDGYYMMSLKFGASAAPADSGLSGDVARANDLIRHEKYEDAKAVLETYLTAHPDDRGANMLLGVADTYRADSIGAAKAFDAAGPIPERYKIIAGKAYGDAAVEALKAKNNEAAIALAGKALAVQPNVSGLYIEGTALANVQRYPEAIADLEKAKIRAIAGNADAATLNAIDASLATSYMFNGQAEKGLALAQDVKRRDPSSTRVDDAVAAYYSQQAGIALKAGKKDEAIADLESAAKSLPSRAGVFYVQAANLLASATPVEWKRVKAEADKALALDGNDARANYVVGVAMANMNDPKTAIEYLQKAKAHVGTDASLSAEIDAALKKLGVAS